MEDNREAIEKNTEESIETKAEETTPAADSVMDDDIQYTFVVPKGEVFREPEETLEPEKTLVADRRRFTEEVNEALEDAAEADAQDEFFEAYKAADPTGRTIFLESPIFDASGIPDDDDITYTFVVPKGEIYKEPDPEEERAAKEAEKAKRAVAKAASEIPPGSTEILSAETKVMERTPGADKPEKKTRYGLPVNHPEMGELAKKQAERRRYKQRKKNRFMTRFYFLMTALILLIFWLIISNSGMFTIDAIEVRGNTTSGHNIIYQANIKETREFLEQNPYIKHAEVRRKLPSTLVIDVTEREERLVFKYDDDYLVMDEDGILLRKTRNKPMTTIIQGIVVSKIKLGEKIGTENSTRMDMALDLIKEMIKADLYYVKLDIENVKTIKAYIYDTLIVKTDYDTLMTNMENGKLHLVVEQLFKDGIERGTITFNEDGSVSFMPIF